MGFNGQWQSVKLGELISVKHGWPFRSEQFSEELTGRPIIVSIGNFDYTGGFRFEHTTLNEYRGDYPKGYDLNPGDVLLVMTCQTSGGEILGIPGRIPNDGRKYLHNQRMGKIVLKRPDLVDLNYLYWLCLWPEFNLELVASSSGTKIVHTAPSRIEAYTFALPSRQEQEGIAHVLDAMQNKIELNRRMNHTLEGLARAIFKSWFVDFDPVVAKAAGKKPAGMSAATAALFPDRFQDSDLGPMPKGWRVSPIGDLVEVVGGSTPSTNNATYWDNGSIHWATPKDMANLTDPVLLNTASKITIEGLGQISSRLLPEGTVLLSSRAPIGYLAIAMIPVAINQGFIAMKCNGELSKYYTLHWTRENMDSIMGRANGTTFLEISKSNFRPIPAVVPSREIVARFDEIVGGLFNRVAANLRQSQALISLRDTLLPQLMSGELRVKQAEAVVEAAVAELPFVQPALTAATPQKSQASDEFKEAILISALVRALANDQFPLGRKRYTKFSYLVHRKADHDVRQQYLHKAAGPYSPWTRYQGPEKIAQKNGYIQPATVEQRKGFASGDKMAQIDKYLDGRYGFDEAIRWAVATFRYVKTDELGLLATVDFAGIELADKGQPLTVKNIRVVLASHPDWVPKLEQTTFSDFNIARVLRELDVFFPVG